LNLRKGLFISFAAHIIVIILMTIRFVFFSPQVIDVSQAVQVDMVALPDKADQKALPEKVQDILKEKTPPAEKPEPEPEPEVQKAAPEKTKEIPQKKIIEPKVDAINLNKAKQKQKNAFNKLKKLSAIDKIKQDLKNDTDKKLDSKNSANKGRALSAGTKIAGLDKLQSDEYLSQLDAQIKSHWNLPQWMIGKPFKASVWVKLNPDGTVASKTIARSSGNTTYDEYCLAAIEKAAPFPAVPNKFSEVYKTDGVSFAFPD
jgi:colicin import membrane protein